jgi:hypothetical protein
MIAGPESFPAAKIGDARSSLRKKHVDSRSLQNGDQEVIAVKRIRQHHIAGGERRFDLPQ